MKRLRTWVRKRRQRRQRRRDAKGFTSVMREFVYLDEVSLFSLLASLDGMIAAEVTDTHASTLMSEVGASTTASAGVLGATIGSKTQSSEARTTQVLRKAIVQSTFRELYLRVRSKLAISAPATDQPPMFESFAALRADGSHGWVLDPADLRRGDLVELTVELEAEPLFQARTVVNTFLDIFEKDKALFGIQDVGGLAEAAAVSRVIEKLGAGLVPLRARARDYVIVIPSPGTELIVHREVVAGLGPAVQTVPLYLVGVAEESLFWKDTRSVVFDQSEFQVLARILRPDLRRSWTPLKLVDVLGRVVPQIHEAFASVNSGVLDAMAQGAARSPAAPERVHLVLREYAELLAESVGEELRPDEKELVSLLDPPTGLQHGSSVKQWRSALDPITAYVEATTGEAIDRATAARLRVLAQTKHGLGPLDPPVTADISGSSEVVEADGRLLDTEIIAIYW